MEKNQSEADQVPNKTAVIEKGLPTEKLHLMKAAPLHPCFKRIFFSVKDIYKDKVKMKTIDKKYTQESGDIALEKRSLLNESSVREKSLQFLAISCYSLKKY